MPQPDLRMIAASGVIGTGRISDNLRALTLEGTLPADGRAFTIFDCFDQSLRKAGQVLVDTGGELLLFGGAKGLVRQTAERTGNFPADLAEGPVKAALCTMPPLRSLVAAGRGLAREGLFAAVDSERKTRARLNVLILEPDGNGAPVSLVVARGLRGYGKSLRSLCDAVDQEVGDTAIGTTALFATLFPDLRDYDVKPVVSFSEEETAYQAANDIVAVYIGVARQNEPGVIADHDTEFLHDYRIALRKIRSVLSLFKGVYSSSQTEKLKDIFSGHMAATGRLRDLDVYLLDRQHYFDLLPESLHSGLDAMFRMFGEERKLSLRKLSRRLKSKTYLADMEALTDLFSAPAGTNPGPRADRPANEYAKDLIWKRYRQVCRVASVIDAGSPDAEVHALRIQCKKLRYLMEFFGPLFQKKDFKPLLKPLKHLQDNLGLFNDYSVQQESLQLFLDTHAAGNKKEDVELAKSVGALIAVLHQRQVEERARVMSNFAQFNSPEVRASFRRLFKT